MPAVLLERARRQGRVDQDHGQRAGALQRRRRHLPGRRDDHPRALPDPGIDGDLGGRAVGERQAEPRAGRMGGGNPRGSSHAQPFELEEGGQGDEPVLEPDLEVEAEPPAGLRVRSAW